MAASNFTSEQAILKEVNRQDRNRRAIRLWLACVLLVLFGLVLVGGATRLTNSGLSITQWQPIHGVIPPLNAQEWQEECRSLQAYPAVPASEQGYDGSRIQGHLLVGVGTSAACARHRRHLRRAFAVLRGDRPCRAQALAAACRHFRACGLQGAIGWWMVSSGLEATYRCQPVSPRHASRHRLSDLCRLHVVHAGIVATFERAPPTRYSAKLAGLIAIMALFQIISVLSSPDWMPASATIPGRSWMAPSSPMACLCNRQAGSISSRTRRWCNSSTVSAAYALFTVVAINMIISLRGSGTDDACAPFRGFVRPGADPGDPRISTLLLQVPLDLALAHQAGALIVFGFTIANWRGFYGELPRQTSMVVGS